MCCKSNTNRKKYWYRKHRIIKMKKIRLGFIGSAGAVPDFNIQNNIFTYILSKEYDVIVDNTHPEYIITGDHNLQGFNGVRKIYWTPDPHTHDNPHILFNGTCDTFMLQYDIPLEHVFRVPYYIYICYDAILRGNLSGFNYFSKPREYNKELLNRKFCNFVCGGRFEGDQQFRDWFYKKLSRYKHIDCPGPRYNNMPMLSPGNTPNYFERSYYKTKFQKNYKFSMSFESMSNRGNYQNDNSIGYQGNMTEKLVEPMMANSLPLYWGNKEVYKEFNTKSFLNFHEYNKISTSTENDLDEFIEKIIEIDQNDDLYMEYMMQPYVIYNPYFDEDFLLDLIKKIFTL